MGITITDIGENATSTYWQEDSNSADQQWILSLISSNRIEATLDYQGRTFTLWFQGQFDTSHIPQGVVTLSDLPDPPITDRYSGIGIGDVFIAEMDPYISYSLLEKFMGPQSNDDYATFFSGDDNYINSAGATDEDSDSYFLYGGNDVLFQNHPLLTSRDHYYGGSGIDTIVFSANRLDASITASQTIWNKLDPSQDLTGFVVADSLGLFNTIELSEVERALFNDGALAFDIALWNNAGSAYRLYKAAFDRAPDEVGLGYWIDQLDGGGSLQLAASGFIHSAEFESLYGANPSDTLFLTKLYNNVLDRDPDAGGLNYWIGQLNGGMSRESALINFSESNENVSNVAELIVNGIQYQPWIG